jgi:hypothetical protein
VSNTSPLLVGHDLTYVMGDFVSILHDGVLMFEIDCSLNGVEGFPRGLAFISPVGTPSVGAFPKRLLRQCVRQNPTHSGACPPQHLHIKSRYRLLRAARPFYVDSERGTSCVRVARSVRAVD